MQTPLDLVGELSTTLLVAHLTPKWRLVSSNSLPRSSISRSEIILIIQILGAVLACGLLTAQLCLLALYLAELAQYLAFQQTLGAVGSGCGWWILARFQLVWFSERFWLANGDSWGLQLSPGKWRKLGWGLQLMLIAFGELSPD